nr:class I SAM-dependent methyltransferase [Maliibacterium massiliense]
MKENKYDDPAFFDAYSHMSRSEQGLSGAGEWHALEKLLPDFTDKRVLDLGCGYGWHCRYAAAHGARSVLGTDISRKMLDAARARTSQGNIAYKRQSIEDWEGAPDSFDVVLSSLAFHYVAAFEDVCRRVYRCLSKGGDFVFSVEHPVFTAYGTQDWHRDEAGGILHWPVDRYFDEGPRSATFLGMQVTKYHRTLTTYVGSLFACGFAIEALVEPMPQAHMLPQMPDELRRPMMLLIAAKKR